MNVAAIPLLPSHAPGARVAWWQGQPIDRETFLAHVNRVAEALPEQHFAINLCEDRYGFLVAFAAVIARGQTNLLPPGRVAAHVQAIAGAYPGSYRLTDTDLQAWLGEGLGKPALAQIAAEHTAAVVFTSGSSGQPRAHPKRWGDLVAGARLAQRRFGFKEGVTVVATVPPQHMYGLETSILVPLISGAGVHGSRPLFPADIGAALTAVPVPRVLITTPIHLRACVQANLPWPELAFLISATAPLSRELAQAAERIFAAPVLEIYGFTEAGSLASRRTLDGDLWRLYDGMQIREGRVSGEPLPEPMPLNDIIELHGQTHFKLIGRREDLVNIAGKRASLADLNQKLIGIEGVEDGVFVMPDEAEGRTIRLAALVVAPALSEQQIRGALAERIDPAFLPRPLYKVQRLPRNETGKLPRGQVLALLARAKAKA